MGPVTESLGRVTQWLRSLRALDAAPLAPHLSATGAAHALHVALDALSEAELQRAIDRPGRPFPRGVVVCARTVFTAPSSGARCCLPMAPR